MTQTGTKWETRTNRCLCMWPESPAPMRSPAASEYSLCLGCWAASSSGGKSSPPWTAVSFPHTHEMVGSGDHRGQEVKIWAYLIWFKILTLLLILCLWVEAPHDSMVTHSKTIPHVKILMQWYNSMNYLRVKVTRQILFKGFSFFFLFCFSGDDLHFCYMKVILKMHWELFTMALILTFDT